MTARTAKPTRGAFLLVADNSSKVERDARLHVWALALRGVPVDVQPYGAGRWLAFYPLARAYEGIAS